MTAIHEPIPGPALDHLAADLAPTGEEAATRLFAAGDVADRAGWIATAYALRDLAGEVLEAAVTPTRQQVADEIARALMLGDDEGTRHA